MIDRLIPTFVFLGVVTLSLSAHADQPVPATIEAILKSPDAYAGKFVQLNGQIDNCSGFVCHLCPENMTNENYNNDQCLAMSFDGYSDDNAGVRTQGYMETAFRFATVTLNATFDPACLIRDPKSVAGRKLDEIVVCSDRAPVLLNARIENVLSRKSALDGIVSGYEFGKLSDAPLNELPAMSAAFQKANYSASPKFFLVTGNPYPPEDAQEGLGCVCGIKSCDGHWPTHWFDGFESPANNFVCYYMLKKNGEWRVIR